MDEETKQFILDTNKDLIVKINGVLQNVYGDISKLKHGQNEIINICKSNQNSLNELIKHTRGLPAWFLKLVY